MDLLGTKRQEELANRVVGRLDTLAGTVEHLTEAVSGLPEYVACIADHLKTLVDLYTVDLTFRGVIRPDADEEGEVVETDDAEIALLIEKLRNARPDRVGKGLYIGDEEEKWGDGTPVIPEELPSDRESLFGGGWGINVGPEGAEENWSGPDGNGSAPNSDTGDVRGHSSGEVKEG